MRFYSGLEIDRLIEEITDAAYEAIDQAASEAARAAALELLELEVLMMKEAERWRGEAQALKQAGRKNILLAFVTGILGGLAVGVSLIRN